MFVRSGKLGKRLLKAVGEASHSSRKGTCVFDNTRRILTAGEHEAQTHRCGYHYLPCCPLQEALYVLPNILAVGSPPKSVCVDVNRRPRISRSHQGEHLLLAVAPAGVLVGVLHAMSGWEPWEGFHAFPRWYAPSRARRLPTRLITGREYCITCVATSSGVPFCVTPPMPV